MKRLSKLAAFHLSVLVLATALFSLVPNYLVGQELQAGDTAKVKFLNNRKFYIYKVAPGETLFGISSKFGIPQDEITELNQEVIRKGLKPRSELWIPAYSWRNKKIPAAPAEPTETKAAKKGEDRLHVVVFAPIDLDKVYIGPESEGDTSHVFEPIERTTLSSLHFVEGVLYGAEEFAKSHKDVSVKVTVVDTEQDTSKVAKMIWRFRNSSDIWITNESGIILQQLSRNAERHGVQLISCGVNTAQTIASNGKAVAMLPSSLTQCELVGKYMSKKYKNANGVFVKTSTQREGDRLKSFRKGWDDGADNAARTVDYDKAGVEGIIDSLRKGRMNIVFIPSADEARISVLLNSISEKADTSEIIVVGLPTWFDFQTVDPTILRRCNVQYFNPGAPRREKKETLAMRRYFRDKYAAEPLEISYIGHDAVSMVLNGRSKSGPEFLSDTTHKRYEGLFTDYHFERDSKETCFENHHIVVWTFENLVPERVEIK